MKVTELKLDCRPLGKRRRLLMQTYCYIYLLHRVLSYSEHQKLVHICQQDLEELESKEMQSQLTDCDSQAYA